MPEILISALTVSLGLAWGSFLNVCITRLPQGYYFLLHPSACPICHARLSWYHNIPVFSWIALRGHCATCQVAIPLQYPVVEVVTACAVSIGGLYFGWSVELGLLLLFLSSLLVASVIDAELQIIPNRLTYPLIFIGWGQAYLVESGFFATFSDAVLGTIVGGGVLWSIAILYRKIRIKEGMGLGDAKFLAMLGAWFGWQAIPPILVVASISALLLAGILIWRKRMTWHTPLPFGPFLSFGCLVYLAHQNIF